MKCLGADLLVRHQYIETEVLAKAYARRADQNSDNH